MARILYLLLSDGGLTGGHKMMIRHVETLRDLGFDAAIMLGVEGRPPAGIAHRAPILPPLTPAPDDTVVLSEDAREAIRLNRLVPERGVIFAQGYADLGVGFERGGDAGEPPVLMAISPRMADVLRRMWPAAQIEVVPCFADERLFRPAAKIDAVSCTPRKREQEVKIIHRLFRHLHRRHADLPWGVLRGASEAEVAQMFGRTSLHLSLPRMESFGLTTLEAMACGCVCAGFLGVGGHQYGTPENGFWVAEDDCVAAADALAEAADLVQTGGPALAARIEAAQATAAQWSYARFRGALEEAWMRLAPAARLRNGPLDA